MLLSHDPSLSDFCLFFNQTKPVEYFKSRKLSKRPYFVHLLFETTVDADDNNYNDIDLFQFKGNKMIGN